MYYVLSICDAYGVEHCRADHEFDREAQALAVARSLATFVLARGSSVKIIATDRETLESYVVRTLTAE